MGLFKTSPIASTLRAWLHGASTPEDSGFIDRAARLEDIRKIMMAAASETGDHPALLRRMRFAADITALWYLRSDLMAVLCDSLGELAARARLKIITQMFDGLVPAGFMGHRESIPHHHRASARQSAHY
jgi:hypothetical protein